MSDFEGRSLRPSRRRSALRRLMVVVAVAAVGVWACWPFDAEDADVWLLYLAITLGPIVAFLAVFLFLARLMISRDPPPG